MRKTLTIFLIFLLFFSTATSTSASAEEIKEFLKSCGYGTLIGAMAGIVSLGFEKVPNEHSQNIARGASLGLYSGIFYGLYEIKNQKKIPSEDVFHLHRPQGLLVLYNPSAGAKTKFQNDGFASNELNLVVSHWF